MLHRRPIALLGLLLLIALPLAVRANPFYGWQRQPPPPPMHWDEMQQCPSVVVATLSDFKPGAPNDETAKTTVTLKIQRVISDSANRIASPQSDFPLNPPVQPGTTITVTIGDWYVIQTRPETFPDENGITPPGKDDGIPRLCYLATANSPGPMEPRVLLPDARQPALYFLTEDRPRLYRQSFVLERMGQVQPAEDADAWASLHEGKTQGTLLYRLFQEIDPQVKRDALEELYQTRDPAVIRALVARLSAPSGDVREDSLLDWQLYRRGTDAREALSAIGDRKDGVYDAVRALFQPPAIPAAGTPLPPYQPPFLVMMAMAGIDPNRAVKDFEPYLHAPWKDLRLAVVNGLAEAHTEAALNHLIDMANDPDAGPSAIMRLYECLRPEATTGWDSPQDGDTLKRTNAHLLARLRPRFPELLRASAFTPPGKAIDAGYMKSIRELFSPPSNTPPAIDRKVAETLLLSPHPSAETFDWEGPGMRILDGIKASGDPSYIPLLVRSMRATRLGNSRTLYNTVMRYIFTSPNTLRREMQAQGVDEAYQQRLVKESKTEYNPRDDGDFFAFRWRLGYIAADEESYGFVTVLDNSLNTGGPRVALTSLSGHFRTSPAYVAEAVREAREATKHILDSHEFDLKTLPPFKIAFLLACAPAGGKAVFEPLLAHRSQFPADQQAQLLALAIRCGETGYTPELISTVLRADSEQQAKARTGEHYVLPEYAELLLTCDSPDALHAYLELADSRRLLNDNLDYRGIEPYPYNQKQMNWQYGFLVAALFPRHPDAFFERALFLLESPELVEREMGVSLLKNALHTAFDFPARGFAATRQAKLVAVRAAIRQLSGLTPAAMRQTILRREGIALSGSSSPVWLPKLAKAIHENPDNDAITGNSLALIETLTSDPYRIQFDAYDRNESEFCRALSKFSGAERDRAVAARIADFATAGTKAVAVRKSGGK